MYVRNKRKTNKKGKRNEKTSKKNRKGRQQGPQLLPLGHLHFCVFFLLQRTTTMAATMTRATRTAAITATMMRMSVLDMFFSTPIPITHGEGGGLVGWLHGVKAANCFGWFN